MKDFELLVDGERVVVRAGPESCEIDGRTVSADIADLGRGGRSVIIDGVQHTVHALPSGPASYEVAVAGSVLAVEVRDPRRLAPREAGGVGQARQEVRAPMPGKVLEVHVSEGSEVERGQGLAIVEAMKMQNELQSPRDGRVVHVHVKAGDSVAAGDALIVVG